MSDSDKSRGALGTGVITPTIARLSIANMLYVVDQGASQIQLRTKDNLGLVAQLGSAGSGDDQFSTPTRCACDLFGVYIVDQGNDRVVKRDGMSLAYHTQFSTAAMEASGIGFVHVDRKRQYVGRKDTAATVYVRHKNSPFGSEGSTMNCGADTIVGLCAIQYYVYVAKLSGVVEKRLISDGTLIASWNNVPAGYALTSITTDGTYVYALCTQAATDGRIVRLGCDALFEIDNYDLTAYQQVVDIVVDGTYLYFVDTAVPTLYAVVKGTGAASGLTPQVNMTTPSGIGLLPPYFTSLLPEAVGGVTIDATAQAAGADTASGRKDAVLAAGHVMTGVITNTRSAGISIAATIGEAATMEGRRFTSAAIDSISGVNREAGVMTGYKAAGVALAGGRVMTGAMTGAVEPEVGPGAVSASVVTVTGGVSDAAATIGW